MSKLRRKLITVLAVLFCALLTISTALMIPKTKTAEAYISQEPASVTQIWNGSKKAFDNTKMQLLYSKIKDAIPMQNETTANDESAFDAVERRATTTGTPLSSAGIQVQFGGFTWMAVYLSKTTEITGYAGDSAPAKGKAAKGDVVLTLWLSYSTISAQWTIGQVGQTANGSAQNPANMYGTSYMRSYVLANGGKYWNGSTLVNTGVGNYGFSDYTTVSASTNALPQKGDYLVAPRYIGWQYQQSALVTTQYNDPSLHRNFDNDAWGTMGTNTFASGYCYEGKTGYDEWKDDLVWLPSISEIGVVTSQGTDPVTKIVNVNDNATDGLWETSYAQRRSVQTLTTSPSSLSWTRSACGEVSSVNYESVYMQDGYIGNNVRYATGYSGMAIYVRPAIHLNLTKANNAATGLSFGIGTAGTDVDTENINGDNVKIASIEDTYSNTLTTAATIDVLDYNNLKIEAISGVDVSDVTTIPDIESSGKFSAVKPDTADDKTYEIQVTPIKGYHWDDTDNPNEWKKPRRYRIKIKLAEITAAWPAKTIASGQSLLPDSNPTVFGGASVESSIDQRFYKVEPNGTDTPPADWLTNGGWNVQWEQRNASSNYFKANQTGTYTVYYEIDANFHNTKRGSYTVTVSTDSVHISTNSGITISDEIFGDNNAAALKTNLIDNFDSWITMTGSSGTYSATALQALLSKLEVVLLDDSGMEVVPDAGHDYYNVGTYSLGLQYIPTLPSSDKTLTFVWDTDKPQITIVKRPITVNIVVKNAGDSFTHVYGDSPVGMKCEPDNPNDIPTGENFSDLLIRDNVFVLKGTTTELNNRTAANTYDIEGVARESNYDVSFESVQYTVTPRPITLQVADEEVEYGTDFTNFTFKAMTRTGGTLASGDTVSALTANATYKLWQNGDVVFSTTLAIGDYELRAEIPTGNYEFTIVKGNLKITKANFNMDGVKLENKGYVYDGQPHAAQISGKLPSDEITVSYRYVDYNTNEELDGAPVEVGMYLVYASFSHENPNYNQITTVKAAYIRIAYTEEEANADFPPLPTDEELAANADLAKKKTEAKKTLDEEAKKKKDEIDADVNLSAEEKKAAKDEIDKELKEGNAAIDKAKDADGINKAYDDGKKEIEDTTELAQKKGAAKSELDKAAQAKKDAIDSDPNLTDEEKAAAKAEVDKELEEGKKAIDGANSVDSVSSAESSTKTNIENIKAEHKGSFPWWILAIIAGAILLVTVLIIVIVKRRNSDDDDGYDDYYDDEYDYDEEEEFEDGGDEAYGY